MTAERFFRIDRAQEDLYYVVDICHEDLFILDPQFDEKDDLDLFASEEVIAKVVGSDESTNSFTAIATNMEMDEQLSNLSESNFTSLDIVSNDAEISNNNQEIISKYTVPELNYDDYSEPYRRQLCKLDKIRPNNINCSNNLNIHSNLTTQSKQNENLSGSNSGIDLPIPPKSPKRHQKRSPQSNRQQLQNQLMLAARNGDISLLKHLHHKGVNLMLIDEKGEAFEIGF